jgi:hypothetical protein
MDEEWSVACRNFELCEAMWPPMCNDTRWGSKGICVNCDVAFGRPLAFRDCQGDCAVCMDPCTREVEWPGCPARHAFCIACFSRMAWPRTMVCDGMCGYSDDDEESPEVRPPRIHPDCRGDCCGSPLSPTQVTCPMCRAPREDPKPLW